MLSLQCSVSELLHSAQIQIYFPMKEAIVTTPYSGFGTLRRLHIPKKVRRSFQGEGTHKLPSPLTHTSPVSLAPWI